jgi:HPt (histidine-containing phosphotransfer) domain-containing protein
MARLTASQREGFEALRREFLAHVPARIAAIQRAAAELQRGPVSRDRVEDLQDLAHRLAGASAIFGLPRLSAAARGLEELATRIRAGGAEAEELDAHTAALEARWNESAAPRPPRGSTD